MSVEFVIEGGERADARHHHRHRMSVAAETVEETVHLVVDHGVARHAIVEVGLLRGGRQLAIEKQVAGLEEVAVLGQLVDRITSIEEHALVAVDVGDLRFRAGGRGEARIVGEHAGLGVELADVDDRWTDGAFADRQFDGFLADGEGCRSRGRRLDDFVADGKGGGSWRHRASPIGLKRSCTAIGLLQRIMRYKSKQRSEKIVPRYCGFS